MCSWDARREILGDLAWKNHLKSDCQDGGTWEGPDLIKKKPKNGHGGTLRLIALQIDELGLIHLRDSGLIVIVGGIIRPR